MLAATNKCSHTVALLLASVQHIFEHVLGARTHMAANALETSDSTGCTGCTGKGEDNGGI